MDRGLIDRALEGVVQRSRLVPGATGSDVADQHMLEIVIRAFPLPGFGVIKLGRIGRVIDAIPDFAILMVDEVIKPVGRGLGRYWPADTSAKASEPENWSSSARPTSSCWDRGRRPWTPPAHTRAAIRGRYVNAVEQFAPARLGECGQTLIAGDRPGLNEASRELCCCGPRRCRCNSYRCFGEYRHSKNNIVLRRVISTEDGMRIQGEGLFPLGLIRFGQSGGEEDQISVHLIEIGDQVF